MVHPSELNNSVVHYSELKDSIVHSREINISIVNLSELNNSMVHSSELNNSVVHSRELNNSIAHPNELSNSRFLAVMRNPCSGTHCSDNTSVTVRVLRQFVTSAIFSVSIQFVHLGQLYLHIFNLKKYSTGSIEYRSVR
jgi:hypothetical protein